MKCILRWNGVLNIVEVLKIGFYIKKKKKKNYLVINDKNDESNIGIFLESLESLENYEILYEKNRNDLNKILWFRNIFIVF